MKDEATMNLDTTDPDSENYDPIAARDMRRATDSRKLYDLGIGEVARLNYKSLEAVRVPGGWLFRQIEIVWDNDAAHGRREIPGTTTFVPYSDEFNPKKKEKTS